MTSPPSSTLRTRRLRAGTVPRLRAIRTTKEKEHLAANAVAGRSELLDRVSEKSRLSAPGRTAGERQACWNAQPSMSSCTEVCRAIRSTGFQVRGDTFVNGNTSSICFR